MPKVKVNDINMYYEIHGEGEPFIMIQGLGVDIDVAAPIISEFAKKYKVIAFDNRGVGRTDKPDMHYSVEMMAEDTIGLMNALDIQSAHIIGASMGSRIAQALAEKYPERAKSLILHVAAARVPHKENLGATIAMWLTLIMIKLGQVEKTLSSKYPPTRKSLLRQFNANVEFDGRNSLSKIQAPTLIVNGTKDISNPMKCTDELVQGIKNSKLVLVEGDHFFAATNLDLLVMPSIEFLEEIDAKSYLKEEILCQQ